MESRPRGETFYAVGRSNENTRSPLDFVSGYGLVFAPFRARPTRNFLRRAFVGTLERGNETGCMPIAARAEPVGPSPHTAPAFERSILDCLSSAWENCKGGTPFARFFPPFLAGQEMEDARPPLTRRVPSHGMEPPEANDDLYKLQFADKQKPPPSTRGRKEILPRYHPQFASDKALFSWITAQPGTLYCCFKRRLPGEGPQSKIQAVSSTLPSLAYFPATLDGPIIADFISIAS